jgi:tetratricopeptide (TPR) repeat protein
LLAGSINYLARIVLAEGAPEEAIRLAGDVLALAPPEDEVIFALATRAAAYHALRNLDAACTDGARAAAMIEAQGGVSEGEVFTYLVCAEAQDAAGRVDEARATLGKALASLGRTAGAIADPSFRTAYRTRVRENAQTLALAEKWGVSEGSKGRP